jgi:hypothetical protein
MRYLAFRATGAVAELHRGAGVAGQSGRRGAVIVGAPCQRPAASLLTFLNVAVVAEFHGLGRIGREAVRRIACVRRTWGERPAAG